MVLITVTFGFCSWRSMAPLKNRDGGHIGNERNPGSEICRTEQERLESGSLGVADFRSLFSVRSLAMFGCCRFCSTAMVVLLQDPSRDCIRDATKGDRGPCAAWRCGMAACPLRRTPFNEKELANYKMDIRWKHDPRCRHQATLTGASD